MLRTRDDSACCDAVRQLIPTGIAALGADLATHGGTHQVPNRLAGDEVHIGREAHKRAHRCLCSLGPARPPRRGGFRGGSGEGRGGLPAHLLAVGRASKPVVSQAVHLITQHNGAIRIDELCRRLGYSRRYLGICLHPGVQALLGPCSTAYLSARNEFGDLFYGA